jgi:hypothetical protein
LPWLFNIASGTLAGEFGSLMRTPAAGISESTAAYNDFGNLYIYQDLSLWVLLIACLGLGLLMRQRGVLIVGVWWLLIFIITNPHWLGLPGTGIVSNFASLIAIYVPTSLIVGLAVGNVAANLLTRRREETKKSPSVLRFFVFEVLILALGLFGLPQRLADLQPNSGILVTPPDVRAAGWVRANLPRENTRFLVNTFTAYNGTLSVGTDAGWWLPLLAGVRTTLPPATYSFEQPAHPNFADEAARFAALATSTNMAQPAWAASLKAAGITHIFVGQRQGRVNYSGPNLNPQSLAANPSLRLVYHEDRVFIFEVLQSQ